MFPRKSFREVDSEGNLDSQGCMNVATADFLRDCTTAKSNPFRSAIVQYILVLPWCNRSELGAVVSQCYAAVQPSTAILLEIVLTTQVIHSAPPPPPSFIFHRAYLQRILIAKIMAPLELLS